MTKYRLSNRRIFRAGARLLSIAAVLSLVACGTKTAETDQGPLHADAADVFEFDPRAQMWDGARQVELIRNDSAEALSPANAVAPQTTEDTREDAAGIPFLGDDPGPAGLLKESYTLDDHGPVYAWYPDDLVPGELYPMVLALNCTNGNPEAEVRTNGWDRVAREDRFIVVSPTYNDSVTHPEAAYIRKVVDDAVTRFPVDTTRIYSTGFSNGGAFSAVLSGTYPGLFAGICGMGWLDAVPNPESVPMTPFVLIQGSKENPTVTGSGAVAVIDDEKNGLRDLFSINGIFSAGYETDYHSVPYWGYPPDGVEVLYPFYTETDPFGGNPVFRSGVEWHVSCYYAPGYSHPFAKLILVDGAGHIPHDYSARIAWDTLKHFRRQPDGRIIEE